MAHHFARWLVNKSGLLQANVQNFHNKIVNKKCYLMDKGVLSKLFSYFLARFK